jgi:hypothetical protein
MSNKKNQQNAQSLAHKLSQKDEIDQKTEYYKSLMLASSNLSDCIEKKIEAETDDYTKNKLIIEKLELENKIFSQKGFYEMWLRIGKDWETDFAPILNECDKMFDELQEKARVVAEKNKALKQVMEHYDNTEEKTLRIRVEYYALIKYEVMKATSSKEEYSLGGQTN